MIVSGFSNARFFIRFFLQSALGEHSIRIDRSCMHITHGSVAYPTLLGCATHYRES